MILYFNLNIKKVDMEKVAKICQDKFKDFLLPHKFSMRRQGRCLKGSFKRFGRVS